MTGELANVDLKVIGIVRNGLKQRPKPGWGEIVSEIVVDSNLIRIFFLFEYDSEKLQRGKGSFREGIFFPGNQL